MKSVKVNTLVSVAFLLGAVSAARAENWYCTREDTTKNNHTFTNQLYWTSSDGAAMTEFDAADDYYACNTMYLSQAPGFFGGPLHFGSIAENKSTTAWIYSGNISCKNYGMVLEKGNITCSRDGISAHSLLGPITVASPVSAPFRLGFRKPTATLHIQNQVFGGVDKGLYVSGGGQTSVACMFYDLSQYQGLITVSNSISNFEMKLIFRNPNFPGSLDLTRDTALQMYDAEKSLEMTVSNMTFRTGSRIIIGGTADAHGSFTASGSLTAEPGVEIYLNFDVPVSKDEQRIVLLSAPVENADFTRGDFTLNASQSDWKHHCHLETTVEDGVKSLVAVFEPLVQQTGSYPYEYEFKNTEAYRASSMTNAARWSDGEIPHGGVHYWTTTNLRTPYYPNEPGVFPGKSLALDGGAIRIFHNEYTITNLIVNGGTVQFVNTCKTSHCERITIMDGKRLSVETYLGNIIEFDSEIAGGGSIWFSGIKRSAGTSSPGGQYVLRKPNLDYMGTICVSQFIDESGYINFDSKFQTLRIADGRCLGGRLPELNPAALTLANYSRLRTIEPTVELEDGFNRGVYIQGCGRFFVDSADGAEKLICNWPITMNGAFYKEGDGCLELGGTVSFQGEDAIGDTPRANSNLFFVSKGTLVPRRHNCCDGMAMSFAKGTKLVVPVVPADAELMKYGLYNVKEGGSISIADTQLAVDFDLSASALPPAHEFTVGIVTVAAAAADDVRGRLKLGATTYKGYRRAKLDEISDETLGTVTFVGRFEQDGLSIIVR